MSVAMLFVALVAAAPDGAAGAHAENRAVTDGDVGVLPSLVLGASGAAQQARVATDLALATSAVLGARQKSLPLIATCDPAVESRCLADEIEKLPGVGVVAQLVVERGENAWILRLRSFGRDGQLVGERRVTTDDRDAGRAAQDVLLAAFDPARRTGRVAVRGVPAGAEVTLDGAVAKAPVDAGVQTFAAVAVGEHVVMVNDNGAAHTHPVVVEFDRTTEVFAGPAAAAAAVASTPWPPFVQPVAVGAVVTGLAAVGASLVLWIVSSENADEWHRRATGRTFPRNGDDPLCSNTECVESGGQVGWTRGYGPLGEDEQVGQGARFMMVAVSRDNELRWDGTNDYATTVAVSATIVLVVSSAALVAVSVGNAGEAAGTNAAGTSASASAGAAGDAGEE